MARQTKEFAMFGVAYRSREYPAIRGMEIFSLKREFHPFDLLEGTEAFDSVRGEWVPLTSRSAVNALVKDMAYIIAPRAVLQSLTEMVHDLNFEFARHWKGVRVPGRFRDGGDSVGSVHIPSMFGQMVTSKVATLRELEEYYSLKDAFVMFDAMTVSSINEALAHEAAAQKK